MAPRKEPGVRYVFWTLGTTVGSPAGSSSGYVSSHLFFALCFPATSKSKKQPKVGRHVQYFDGVARSSRPLEDGQRLVVHEPWEGLRVPAAARRCARELQWRRALLPQRRAYDVTQLRAFSRCHVPL